MGRTSAPRKTAVVRPRLFLRRFVPIMQPKTVRGLRVLGLFVILVAAALCGFFAHNFLSTAEAASVRTATASHSTTRSVNRRSIIVTHKTSILSASQLQAAVDSASNSVSAACKKNLLDLMDASDLSLQLPQEEGFAHEGRVVLPEFQARSSTADFA